MKNLMFMMAVLICSAATAQQPAISLPITKTEIQEVVNSLTNKIPGSEVSRMERGVLQTAGLWQEENGTKQDFITFCTKNYISDPEEREIVFQKISGYMESLGGHFNKISLDLMTNLHLDNGPLHSIDALFGAYSPGAHLSDDFYANKIAFLITLNFPSYSLDEKNTRSKTWSRREWAYARLGDRFTTRVPAELIQASAAAETRSDIYISEYNIIMGNLRDNTNQRFFPSDMVLLSHWNLRDEIKSNYALRAQGIQKQQIIYQVMKQIIAQNIPSQVINNRKYCWDPYRNEVYTPSGEKIQGTPEPDTRYQMLLDNFKSKKAIDAYEPVMNTYIKRQFEGSMEMPQKEVEQLFTTFISAPQIKQVGKLIEKRLGRKLQPYDIWYDGFKARSSIDASTLDSITQQLYPNAPALEAHLPVILTKLGWSEERAAYLASKIKVDPARGSGHAWGAGMKGEYAHLRTRIPESGMNYKGYNIAVHEFGHNVEQTISLYDVDYFMLQGVPNTGFTEALAFMFQSRDLELLGIKNNDPLQTHMKTLDEVWGLYEIMGVALVDVEVWQWMYDHQEATAAELKEAVIGIANTIWNRYYAPVFGMENEPILAIYSHMIASPLYLSNYAYGSIIDFQIEKYMSGKAFNTEVDRIWRLGRLTPKAWMVEAVGEEMSVEPMLQACDAALKVVQ
ncbi:MAG TPA: hypothetical protein PLS41_05730 [Bacteroidales bacterium]|nr:hypothetical protein [Bacteroidales bacterium]